MRHGFEPLASWVEKTAESAALPGERGLVSMNEFLLEYLPIVVFFGIATVLGARLHDRRLGARAQESRHREAVRL